MTTPRWIDFLLYDNQDEILEPNGGLPRPTSTAQIVVRFGRQRVGSKKRARVPTSFSDVTLPSLDGALSRTARVTVTGAPTLLKDINDYLKGGMFTSARSRGW